jgi:hypothetical protein
MEEIMSSSLSASLWVGVEYKTLEDAFGEIDDLYEVTERIGLEYSISYDSQDEEDYVIGIEIESADADGWSPKLLNMSEVEFEISLAKEKLSKLFKPEDINVYIVPSYF